MGSVRQDISGQDAPATVLIVDDEDLFRMTASDILRARHPAWTVLEAADGEGALNLLSSHHIDCIVTDLAMPVLDGVGLLVEILGAYPALPVVVLSAYSGEDGGHFDMPRFFSKPVSVAAVGEAVAALLHSDKRTGPARMSVAGLLQVLAWERRTCTVEVRSGERDRGEICVVGGRVSGAVAWAEARARASDLRGDAAVFELLVAEQPRVALAPARPLDATLAAVSLPQLFARAKTRRVARAGRSDRVVDPLSVSVQAVADQLWAIDGARGVAIVDLSREVILSARGERGLGPGLAQTACTLVKDQFPIGSHRSAAPGARVRELVIALDSRIIVCRAVFGAAPLVICFVVDPRVSPLPLVRIELERAARTLGTNGSLT